MNYAVHATASFFDAVVEHTFVQRGRPLVIGDTPAMAVPVPEGQPYLAKLVWTSPTRVAVVDGQGRQYLLDTQNGVDVDCGPVRLSLRMVPRFRLRRMASMSTVLGTFIGIYLLTVIVGGTGLSASQVYAANEVWCGTWLGAVAPPESLPIANKIFKRCHPPRGNGGGGGGIPGNEGPSDRWAEYLQRILDKDLDGDENGVLTQGDRQFGDRERTEIEIYMPAGDTGPKDKMGGADETELRAVRVLPKMEEPKKPKKAKPKQDKLVNNDVGTKVELPGQELTVDDDGDEDEIIEEVEEPEHEVRKEDIEGWGVRDWYDQEDRKRDQQEVEVMKNLAERILKINPDDPQALSILAYYQYLSEDHDAALETYDRYIELNDEDAAGYNNKALIYKRLKQYDTEERLYRVALTLEPDDTTAMNNLAVNLSHQKRFDEALAIMEQLHEIDPEDAYADLHRAKIFAEMGRDDEALAYLERALQGMKRLDTLHHIEFRQDIRVDPSFDRLRETDAFRAILWRYYGEDTPIVAP